MMRKPPKYCQGFIDRHGKPRWYLRRPGFPRVPLPGLPWSPEFMAAYEAACAGETTPKLQLGSSRTVPGSINALVVSYYRSPEYIDLRPVTQTTYRNVIERFRTEHGDKPVARLEREHVKRMMAKLADRPAAANQWLKVIRILMRHALEAGFRRDNPTFGIRKLKTRSSGYRTWTEDEISRFQEHHEVGTRPRLALDLLLYTGQRRGDVVCIGRQHIRDGVLTIRQSKTGTEVQVPVHQELEAALASVPGNELTFLMTRQGKPFSPAGFTNWFRDCVIEAGLPAGLSPHGLRKAACRRLAEAGCTPHEIMSISGHKNLQEVTVYTAAANRARLAQKAIGSITKPAVQTEKRTKIVKPGSTV